jgi:ketosteroid isomerase-like protein
MDSQVTYDNEAIVRNAYHTAEGSVLDIPGWIDSFTEDGVFNNITGEESYRGEHLKDVVITFGELFLDVHRELHRVNVMGDAVAIELSIQGTFRGTMETPAGVIQPTGAKVNIPCADFFYLRNGKIERFDCYPALNIILKQMGVPPPDFASAVKRSTQR